jgi:hypothetical protein
MFRIRRIYNDHFPGERVAIEQVKDIIHSHSPSITQNKLDEIPEQLRNSLKYLFQTSLFVAESESGNVRGFALMRYATDQQFCFLDLIATKRNTLYDGIGGPLYQRIWEEARNLNVNTMFFECLPDGQNFVVINLF